MIKHRLVILIYLAGSVFALARDFFKHAGSNGLIPLVPLLILGVATGVLLSYGCATWITRNQTEGIVRLTNAAMITIFVYFSTLFVIPMFIYFGNLCSVFGVADPAYCGAGFLRFWGVMNISLLFILLVWSIYYERSIRHRLSYKIPSWFDSREE